MDLQVMSGDIAALWLAVSQIAPTDVNTPWMWMSGILALAVATLFGVLIKNLVDDKKEWRATAKEASAEFPKMGSTLDKAVSTLGIQQTLIETQVRDISSLKDTVTRVERHVEDLRLSIKADAQAHAQRQAGER